jgi:hypothetical protein
VNIAEDALANAEHRPRVPPNEQLEGCAIFAFREAVEQLAVGQGSRRGATHLPQDPG